MFYKVEKDEEDLKYELGTGYDYHSNADKNNNMNDYDNDKYAINYNNLIPTQYKTFPSLKKDMCDLMTEVIESSNFVQRKSFLINQKCMDILDIEANGIKRKSNIFFVPIILFYIILFFFEMPWSVYDWIPKTIKSNFFGMIIIPLSSIIFYFFIFNYAIIQHRYMSGDLIFGNKESGNVNFYNFISYVLGNCDAAFYHSIWVLRKYKDYEESTNFFDEIENRKYFYSPKYFDVFELPEVKYRGIDIIPYISMGIIIISIFNATKFSNIKFRKKEYILFNENADFFYNEKNLYSNYILGTVILIQFKKKLDKMIAEKKLLVD